LPHREIQSLYCAHHGWPCGWRRKKIGSGHHAAHVAQETFVRIIASRGALLAMREPRVPGRRRQSACRWSARGGTQVTFLLTLPADAPPGASNTLVCNRVANKRRRAYHHYFATWLHFL
jgi:hypothetical protein